MSLANWFTTLPHPNLTPTQNWVLRLILAGHSNAEIAKRLGWKLSTAAVRVCEVKRITGVRRQTENKL